jgi:hypothetical protein
MQPLIIIFYLQVKKYCNVVVRQFAFEDNPSHIRIAGVYAWKPLIIAVRTSAQQIIFDPSIRLVQLRNEFSCWCVALALLGSSQTTLRCLLG